MSITEISLTVKHPERFCGMHWVNPPHIVPLVEVICGEKTAERIASYLFADLGSTSEVSPLLGNLVKDGAFGVKSGKGFYDYSDGKDAEAIKNRDIKFLKLAKCLYK